MSRSLKDWLRHLHEARGLMSSAQWEAAAGVLRDVPVAGLVPRDRRRLVKVRCLLLDHDEWALQYDPTTFDPWPAGGEPESLDDPGLEELIAEAREENDVVLELAKLIAHTDSFGDGRRGAA